MKNLSLRKKIFLIASLIGLVAVAVFLFSVSVAEQVVFDMSTENEAESVTSAFENIKKRDADMLSSTLETILRNKEYAQIFLSGDREALYQSAAPLFDKLKQNYGISHWYFHSLDGTNFLRVHNKDIYGDQIKRSVFLEARDKMRLSSGFDLGKTAFALRVVAPYYHEGQHIGYIEVGEEVDHFLQILGESQPESEFAIVGSKNYIDRAQWEEMKKNSKLNAEWGDMGSFVLLNTDNGSSAQIDGHINDALINEVLAKKVAVAEGEGGEMVVHSQIPLTDISQEQIGLLLIHRSTTALSSTLHWGTRIATASFLALVVLMIVAFLYIISKSIIAPINDLSVAAGKIAAGDFGTRVRTMSQDEIGKLVESFNQMADKLKGHYQELRRTVEEKTKKLDAELKKLESTNKDLDASRKAVVNILEDVELEKKHSERLAEDLKKFQLAVESTSDQVIITDKNGVIVYLNKAIEKMTGYAQRDLMGKRALMLALWGADMEADFYEKMWQTIREKKEVFEAEVKNKKKDGSVYDASLSIAPILNKKGEIEFFVSIAKDITKAKEIDRAKTEFVSLASHQLRTPLTAVKWNTEILIEENIPDEFRAYVDQIFQSNERMIELVDSLLNVSRIDMGTFSIEPKEVSPVEIAESVLQELASTIKDKQLVIVKKYPKDPIVIEADPKLLRIVIQNLLSNAVKYTLASGKVSIALKAVKGEILFSVKDTGMGIPVAQQSRIFSKLFRAENAIAKVSDGTGLGLYVAKSVIEQSGGKIWFESKENVGTEFSFSLPKEGMRKKEGTRDLNSITKIYEKNTSR